MRRYIPSATCSFVLLAVVVALVGVPSSLATESKVKFSHASEAPALVQAALVAEEAGDDAERQRLLAEAVKSDPNFAPARWHSGQVKFDGEWRTVEQITSLVTSNFRWKGYRELRESLGDAPEDHFELAKYCRDHSLIDEGRIHWAHVLLADPGNTAARKALGLVQYKGGLFTPAQVKQLEQAAKDSQANLERFRPRLTALCRDAVSGDETKREAALEALAAIDDSAAIEALEIAINKATSKAPTHVTALHGALVSALTRMPQHEATLRLLKYAVYCDSAELRTRASAALKPRPHTDYVPLLMSSLTAPIDVDVEVLSLPDGTVRMIETIEQAGPEKNRVLVRHTNLETEGALRSDPLMGDHAVVLDRHLGRAEAIAETTQGRADALNAIAERRNQRIKDVLVVAAGLSQEDDPETSWDDWRAVNELLYAEATTEVSYSQSTSVHAYHQLKPRYASEGDVAGAGSTFRRGEGAGLRVPERSMGGPIARPFLTSTGPRVDQTGRRHSCFVPGTPVWTPQGPTPIEKLEVGDLVLAQNPATGELAFRAVLQKTVGEPSSVWELKLPNDSIGTTSGHRFWVNGRGWAMAKTIEPNMQLHSLLGPVPVEAVLESERVKCHNLVVDEFHTYFVGDSKLLVHDKGCPLPVVTAVPGSVMARTLPTLDPPLSVVKSGW